MLLRTERFKKHFKRLPAEIRSRVERALELLVSNPRRPTLRAKKMEGAPEIWELRVTENYPVTFQSAPEGILLRRIGTHDLLRRP